MTPLAYSPRVLFLGDVASVSVRGSVLRVRCFPGGAPLRSRVPRMFVQPGCNHALFSEGCGLSADAWEFTATVQAVGSGWPPTVTLEALTRTAGGGLPADAQWFAGGFLLYGAGAGARRLPILQSGTVTAGEVSLTLPGVSGLSPGDPVTLWPGCAGTAAVCAGQFGNFDNFGGHPFVPTSNPSLLKVSTAVGGAKK